MRRKRIVDRPKGKLYDTERLPQAVTTKIQKAERAARRASQQLARDLDQKIRLLPAATNPGGRPELRKALTAYTEDPRPKGR